MKLCFKLITGLLPEAAITKLSNLADLLRRSHPAVSSRVVEQLIPLLPVIDGLSLIVDVIPVKLLVTCKPSALPTLC